jgi:hypothetical protein
MIQSFIGFLVGLGLLGMGLKALFIGISIVGMIGTMLWIICAEGIKWLWSKSWSRITLLVCLSIILFISGGNYIGHNWDWISRWFHQEKNYSVDPLVRRSRQIVDEASRANGKQLYQGPDYTLSDLNRARRTNYGPAPRAELVKTSK